MRHFLWSSLWIGTRMEPNSRVKEKHAEAARQHSSTMNPDISFDLGVYGLEVAHDNDISHASKFPLGD